MFFQVLFTLLSAVFPVSFICMQISSIPKCVTLIVICVCLCMCADIFVCIYVSVIYIYYVVGEKLRVVGQRSIG